MEEHDEEVSLFVSLTGATPETARQYLEAMEWKVQEAFEMYSTVESDPTPRVTSPPQLSGSGAMNDLLSNMEDEAAAFGFPDLNDTPPYQGADPLDAISSMLNEARASQRRMGDTVDPLTGIRAPQAAFRDTLIGPSSGMMMGGLGRGGMASLTDDLEASDWMFAPPDSVKGDIIEARRMAKEQGKWLLVNLQDVEIFESHQLNRDTWKNDTIQALLETSFIFWQRSSTSQAGRDFLRLYGLSADVCLPHIAILGPTGSQLWSRTGFIQPDDLSIALVEFMEANDLNAMTKPKERHFGRAAGGAGSSRSSATYDGSKSRDANDESGERHVLYLTP